MSKFRSVSLDFYCYNFHLFDSITCDIKLSILIQVYMNAGSGDSGQVIGAKLQMLLGLLYLLHTLSEGGGGGGSKMWRCVTRRENSHNQHKTLGTTRDILSTNVSLRLTYCSLCVYIYILYWNILHFVFSCSIPDVVVIAMDEP